MGDQSSILDAYLSWAWFRTVGEQISPGRFPHVEAMSKRHAERASAKRVAEIERAAQEELKAAGLYVGPKE